MITLAGIPLLLEDNEGFFRKFHERYLSLELASIFGDEPVSIRSDRTGSISGNRAGVGLGLPNYTPAPPPAINELYWPTGATRWARGYFLADDRRKDQILSRATRGSSPRAIELLLNGGRHSPVRTQMYLLTPRQISVSREEGLVGLWVLPLVDERYFWQFKKCDDLAVQPATSWADLFSSLGSALGVQVSHPTIDSYYLGPDPVEFSRRFDNPAAILDAAAHSVGLRIVRSLAGNVQAMSQPQSHELFQANVSTKHLGWIAGKEFSSNITHRPRQVTVAFPKYASGNAFSGGEMHAYTKSDSISGAPSYQGTVRVIRSSAYANCTDAEGETPPANEAQLDGLADAIANDYFEWMQKGYDKTVATVFPWRMTGFDDYVLFQHSRQLSNNQYVSQMRVCSMPYDFGVEDMLHQDPSLFVIGGPVAIGKADDEISAGSSGTVSVWTAATPGAAPSDSGFDVQAKDWMEAGVEAGAKVVLVWDGQQNKWLFVKGGDSPGVVWFTLADTLDLGGSAAATMIPDGDPIMVEDPGADPGTWSGLEGAIGAAVKKPESESYYILWLDSYPDFIDGTLSEDMSASVDNKADMTSLRSWAGIDVNDVFTEVWDTRGHFKRAMSGAKFTAAYDRQADQYEVIQSQSKAGFILATATQTITGTPPQAEVTVDHFFGTQQDVQDPAVGETIIKVQDVTTRWPDIQSGWKVLAAMDAESGDYEVIWTNDGKVRVVASDQPAYLANQFENIDTASDGFDPAVDLPIKLSIVTDGLDKKIRAWIDTSAIPGYDAGKLQSFKKAENGGWIFVTDPDPEEDPTYEEQEITYVTGVSIGFDADECELTSSITTATATILVPAPEEE